jgi:hypothetical protein
VDIPAQVGGHARSTPFRSRRRALEGHAGAMAYAARDSRFRRVQEATRTPRSRRRCAFRMPRSMPSTCRSPVSKTRRSSTT